ncbi:phage adaptor protein [Paracoccus sp. 22332]|uniref:phage adaptor protein n=1 Tax=Paracoccus sp. 22332 TaxID=3453913 RepID=UPI003F842DAC
MAFTYASVMRQMATILQDAGAVRWTAPEMKEWIDLALVDVFTAKPNAKVAVVQHPLVAGSRQTLRPEYAMALAFLRNTSGGAVEMLDNLDTLNRWQPGWDTLPGAAKIQYVHHSQVTPRIFTVVPPATAAASLELEVALAPTPAAGPTGASAADMTQYTANVDLPDTYKTAVLHLALVRAFSKDGDNQAAVVQSQGHQAKADKALSDLTAGEAGITAAARVRA